MLKSVLKLAVLAVAALALAISVLGAQAATGQAKKVDAVKLYAEIAGDYDFDAGGRILALSFWEKDGKLWAAERGDEANFVEVKPLDLGLMKFEAYNPEGQYYEILFGRDESGKVNKCTLKVAGIEVTGVRVK
jgi:hypothetical protein